MNTVSYRIPSFTELYYNSPANIGNDQLAPEESVSAELGVKFYAKRIKYDVSVFRRNATNLIDWIRENDTMPWRVVNLSQINTWGLCSSIRIFPRLIWGEKAFFNKVSLSYSYLNQSQLHLDYLSKNVLDYMQHQLILSTFYSIGKYIRQSWNVRFEDRFDYVPHTLIDSKLIYSRSRYNIYLEVSNLLGVKYYEFGGIPMPGRWVRFGVDMRIPLQAIE